MSSTIDRARAELIKAKILRNLDQRRQERSLAEVVRHLRLLKGEPKQPLPDVPLHQRGFGVMDEAAPGDGDAV